MLGVVAYSQSSPRVIVILYAIVLLVAQQNARADLRAARVTQIVREARALSNSAPSRPIVVNALILDRTGIKTGVASRLELAFPDRSVVRLGANTEFRFTSGTDKMILQGGALLLRVPATSGRSRISASNISAEIAGTTALIEYHPDSFLKLIVLEGTARVYLSGRIGESTLVKAGQMLIARANAKRLPDTVDVDIRKIATSSLLVSGFARPLGSEDFIAQETQEQQRLKKSGELRETNLAILGGGTGVTFLDPNHHEPSRVAKKSERRKLTKPRRTSSPSPPAEPTP